MLFSLLFICDIMEEKREPVFVAPLFGLSCHLMRVIRAYPFPECPVSVPPDVDGCDALPAVVVPLSSSRPVYPVGL